MNYYFHIASAGERWDTIAHKYYGNCHKIAPIIMANPHIPVSPIIEEGTEIKVPKFDEIKTNSKVTNGVNGVSGLDRQTTSPVGKLPIWKQQ